MEETAQQERNNLKMKKQILQYQNLDVQSAESVLWKDWSPCIYGTVFIALRHQSIYWLPKHAIKNVPLFSPLDVQLCSPLHFPRMSASLQQSTEPNETWASTAHKLVIMFEAPGQGSATLVYLCVQVSEGKA